MLNPSASGLSKNPTYLKQYYERNKKKCKVKPLGVQHNKTGKMPVQMNSQYISSNTMRQEEERIEISFSKEIP